MKACKKYFSRTPNNDQFRTKITQFQDDYDTISETNPFHCDITGFNAFCQILLIKEMMKFNLEQEKKNLKVNYKLENVDFEVTLKPCSIQRGNLLVVKTGDYDDIKSQMSDISSVDCAKIVQAIREARQTGNPLTSGSFEEICEQDVKFLNQFMFLWNCEIARHLQDPEGGKERKFHDLPVAVGICLANCSIENREPENANFDRYLDKKTKQCSSYHFFSGEYWERETALKNVMPKDKKEVEYFDELLEKEFGPTLSEEPNLAEPTNDAD